MKAAELRTRFLAALYFKTRQDGAKYWAASSVAAQFGLHLPAGMDRMIVQRLVQNGWARLADPDPLGSDDDEPAYVMMTWDGIEAAEQMLDDNPQFGVPLNQEAVPSWAPAADRYVSITDNQRRQIQDDLVDLREIVRGANNVDEIEREIVLHEIALFEAAVVAPRVASELVERFVNGVLAWVSKTIANAVASELIKRLGVALGF